MTKGIKIYAPSNNINERRYAIEALLSFILDENQYEVLFNDSNNYFMETGEGNKDIIIQDGFWSKWHKEKSYLKQDALPTIAIGKNALSPEKDVIIIYGNDFYEERPKELEIGIDLFASAYFMLTRWEEYVVKERDSHNRFSAKNSIAFKNQYLDRPVVNEYAFILKKMLLKAGVNVNVFKEAHYEVVPTHDIDFIEPNITLKYLVKDIIKRRSIAQFIDYLNSKKNNPYDTFDFLMDCSEKVGVKSRFYFMACKSDSRFKEMPYYLSRNLFSYTVSKIKDRHHIIGFHPGYHTSTNEARWTKEKIRLEKTAGVEIAEGRQHVLMYDGLNTANIWEKNCLKFDSTLGYADETGFRCGTGSEFKIFDYLAQCEIKVTERPLVVMDATLNNYLHLSIPDAYDTIKKYIEIGRKYRMPITLLFHNTSFTNQWDGYKEMYKAIMSLH